MTGRGVLAMLAALLGVVAGLGALVGAATITARPPLFLLAGLLAFCVAYSLGLLLATRGVSSRASSLSRSRLSLHTSEVDAWLMDRGRST